MEEETTTKLYVLELLENAKEIEPAVTEDLEHIVFKLGCKLIGLENRFKDEESLTRKLKDRAAERHFNTFINSLAKQSKKINDALRYTVIAEEDKYIEKHIEILKQLSDVGYEIVHSWNAWKDEGELNDRGYRGINVTVRHWHGQLFELQFHTAESWRVKSETHRLYKEWRLRDTPHARKEELLAELRKTASQITAPRNVKLI